MGHVHILQKSTSRLTSSLVLEIKKKPCQPCIIAWVAFTLCSHRMFTADLLDECQVCSCSFKIIHRSPSYPGGATGSWWSGSAKTPNWRRRSAAARSQRGQMPLLMYHVFQAGQQCVLCVSWSGRGEKRSACQDILTLMPTWHMLVYSPWFALPSHPLSWICGGSSRSLFSPSHAVLCQAWSWRLIAATQPILSGGRFFVLFFPNRVLAAGHRDRMPVSAN